jgi:hypothetical protein
MNIKQAKQIPIEDFLLRLGYTPDKSHRGNREVFFFAPGRNERTPSCSVNRDKNVFFDFGADQGGSIIDLAKIILESRNLPSSVKDSLALVRETMGSQTGFLPTRKESINEKPRISSFSFSQQAKYEDGHIGQLQFVSAETISNKYIFNYLQSRGLKPETGKTYLKEVKYRNLAKPTKIFTAIGTPNLSENGYELRSYSDTNIFKSAFFRNISIIDGGVRSMTVQVYESTFDALSGLEMAKNGISADVLILHSTSSFKRAVSYIQNKDYQEIDLFLDNDETGRKTAIKFIKLFGENIVSDLSSRYSSFKDLNEAHKAQVNIFDIN